MKQPEAFFPGDIVYWSYSDNSGAQHAIVLSVSNGIPALVRIALSVDEIESEMIIAWGEHPKTKSGHICILDTPTGSPRAVNAARRLIDVTEEYIRVGGDPHWTKTEQLRRLAIAKDINSELDAILIAQSHELHPDDVNGTEKTVSVLFLSADPTDASRLRLGQEFREIHEILKLAQLRDRFRLELPQLSVRPADISQALLDIQPRIVHFSGHGASTGALCFENQVGQTHLVQPDALAALFKQFAHQVNCVLLNACYSETQAKAVAEHIMYVIGMNQAIGDKAAIAFAIGFYQALGAGRRIEDAYQLGCVSIRLQGIPEHLTPVLIKKRVTQP